MRRNLTIRDVLVVDGSGATPSIGNVHVIDGVLAAAPGRAAEQIDGRGLAIAPGFIDVHTHDDWAVIGTDMAAKLSQGVTTVITGNCGESLAPFPTGRSVPQDLAFLGPRNAFGYDTFAAYLDSVRTIGIPVNVAALVGHATLRVNVMDSFDRPATATERRAMAALLAESLDAGAFGLSTGLEYAAASAAPTDELVELAEECGRRGALYASHLRDEADAVTEAMEEAFEIGRRTGSAVQLSHHKCSGVANFGRSVETLARFDDAAARHDVGLDVYPYHACSTVLDARFHAGSRRTLVTSSRPHPEAVGRDVAELAAQWDCSEPDAIKRLSPAGAVYFDMDEADVRRILAHPGSMIGSDGLPTDAHPHPRLWGTFPRVLGHYVRDVGLFNLAEAVRKMTSLPAARFGIPDRGLIAPGRSADLVLFDPATVRDTATFDQPIGPAAGIHAVWVGGTPMWDGLQPSDHRPGEVLTPERSTPR